METREEKTPQVVLVSPQGEIPMGEVELILEVQDKFLIVSIKLITHLRIKPSEKPLSP